MDRKLNHAKMAELMRSSVQVMEHCKKHHPTLQSLIARCENVLFEYEHIQETEAYIDKEPSEMYAKELIDG